jgi:hypothetical protein
MLRFRGLRSRILHRLFARVGLVRRSFGVLLTPVRRRTLHIAETLQ